MRGRYVMKKEKKRLATIKVIAFILAIIVVAATFASGYRVMEIIFFGVATFMGTFISLVMALAERDKRRANDYKRRNKEYFYDENIPGEYQS